MNKENDKKSKPYSDLDIYNTLLNRRQHIENTFWGRIQTLHLIQVAVLGGAYLIWTTGNLRIPVALIIIGLILTVLLTVLVWNDWEDARVNDEKMCELGEKLDIKRIGKRWFMLSNTMLKVVVILFIIIDIAFMLYIVRP